MARPSRCCWQVPGSLFQGDEEAKPSWARWAVNLKLPEAWEAGGVGQFPASPARPRGTARGRGVWGGQRRAHPNPGHRPSCSGAPGMAAAPSAGSVGAAWRGGGSLPGLLLPSSPAGARRRREVRMRVWAASGAAQLRAEVHLEPERTGWRRNPRGFAQISPAGWEQPGAEHVCAGPATDPAASSAPHPPPPHEFPCLDLRVPDLPKGVLCVLGPPAFWFHHVSLQFTAPLPSSRVGCSPSPPPVTPGTSAAPRTCWSRAAAAPVPAGPRAAALQARPRGRACTLMVPPAVRDGTGSDPGLRVKPSSLGHTTF